MKRAEFGELLAVSGMPVLEIKTKHKTGYLSPFRWYAFQVSATKDEQGDMGSTEVFGLETFASIEQRGRSNLRQKNTVKYFIGVMAMEAVREFCERQGEETPDWYLVCEYMRTSFNDFIDAVYAHVFNGVSEFVIDKEVVA